MGRRRGWASSEGVRFLVADGRAGRWLLAVAILLSGLGLGALHTPVLAAVAALAAIGTGLVWFDAEPLEPRPAATVLVVVAVVLIAWTGAQVLPLPRGVLAAIASENADVWSRCLSPLREEGPALASISLEPVGSRVQILRGVTYLVVFVGALRIARRQEGVAFLERTLLFSTVAVAGAALVHPVLGARKVFGLYEPAETYAYVTNRIAPLLNTNHLAAYVNVGVLLAFASVIERRATLPRPLALVIVLLLGATTVWTFSRGGTATMLLGTLVVVVLAFGARRAKRARVAAPLVVAAVAVGGGAVLLLSAFDGTRAKFTQNNLSKLDLVKNAFDLVRDSPLLGVGRGAFEATFPKVRTGTGYWVFTHPENVIAQWTTEWGVPVAAGALLAIAWALRPRTALARSRPPVGAWAALVAVAVHNLVDFNCEVPGVMVALTVCAAMVAGGTGGGEPTPHRGSGWARRPNALALALGGATVLAIAATLPFSAHELYNEQRSFRDVGLDTAIARPEFHDRAREVMLRHPADPYFPFVGAVRGTAVRDESAIPWAARALERSPVYGRVHLLLARSLFVKNPSQARLEYRTACVQDNGLCGVDESLPIVRGFDDAMELVPEGGSGLAVLGHLASRLEPRLPSTVVRLDREIAARDPRSLAPARRAAARALGDLRDAEAWCVDPAAAPGGPTRGICVSEGIAAATRLRASAPEECDGHALTAELRVAIGEIDAGFAELDRSLEEVTERSPCARRLVSLAVETKSDVRIAAALDRLLKLGCEAPAECVTNLTFAANVEASRGRPRRALALLKKAWERAPERDDLLEDIAGRAAAEGLHGEALEAYTKLADRHPGEPRWTEAVTRERQAATRRVFERR
ncbi:MAG: O-antigen ligase family protein [Labilithrix sp.]|nr:O-antigen ligase family protein [Labilithrix sp.]